MMTHSFIQHTQLIFCIICRTLVFYLWHAHLVNLFGHTSSLSCLGPVPFCSLHHENPATLHISFSILFHTFMCFLPSDLWPCHAHLTCSYLCVPAAPDRPTHLHTCCSFRHQPSGVYNTSHCLCAAVVVVLPGSVLISAACFPVSNSTSAKYKACFNFKCCLSLTQMLQSDISNVSL